MSVEAEADALAAKYPNRPPGQACGVERSGHRLLVEALAARGLQNLRIAEIMTIEKGVKISYQTIQRHRSGVCSCAK